MLQQLVRYAIDGDVAIVSLADPASLNALSPEMCSAVAEAIDDASRNARAIILTGEGRGFCSGANFAADSARFFEPGFDAGAMLEADINPLMQLIRGVAVPIVAAVRGPVAGVGVSLALACDIIVASEDAYFLLAFRKMGLVPDGGASWLLSRTVGRVRAMEMMLLGERVPAATALQWGLVTRVVAADKVQASAVAIAQTLASGPTFALGLIRRGCWAGAEDSWQEALDRERSDQRRAGRNPDFGEAVAAFLEKRNPHFSGDRRPAEKD